MISPHPLRRISTQLRTVILRDSDAEPVSIQDYLNYAKNSQTQIPETTFYAKARAARRLCEKYAGKVCVSQSFKAVLDLPPGLNSTFNSVIARYFGYAPETLELLWSPLRQVSSITITDDGGVSQAADPSNYWVSSSGGPGRITLRNTGVWPDPGGRAFETFSAFYTSGYSIPAKCSGTTLTTVQPHGLTSGSILRVWTPAGGSLPSGLTDDATYYVVTPSFFTLGLSLTSGGAAIDTGTGGTGNLFLGEVPYNMIRAILATMASDYYPERKKSGLKGEGKDPSGLPSLAKELLDPERVMKL